MNAEQFKEYWLKKAGMTAEEFEDTGLLVAVCTCGANDCQGWQVATRVSWELREELARRYAGLRPKE